MCMALHGYKSRPYMDDLGGGGGGGGGRQLRLVEAAKKVCRPAQTVVWLGIFDSNEMAMGIPDGKMVEI